MRKTVYILAKGPQSRMIFYSGTTVKKLSRAWPKPNTNGIVGWTEDIFLAFKFASIGHAKKFLADCGDKKYDADVQPIRVTFKVESIDTFTMDTSAKHNPQLPLRPKDVVYLEHEGYPTEVVQLKDVRKVKT